MKFNQYPEAIAQSSKDLLTLQRQVRHHRDKLIHLETHADTQVAFNTDLKNDAQRKAKRSALLDNLEYRQTSADLTDAEQQLAIAEIGHQFLVNKFTVAKLEWRKSIARMEARTAAGE